MRGSRSSGGDGQFKLLITAASLMISLVITAEYGSEFYSQSNPLLYAFMRDSDLWLWADLISSLYYIAAWPIFFVISAMAVHVTLSVIIFWLLGRFT